MESTSRFDRFEILGPLGAGGMGEVVKARALGPHGFEKVVAIKRIRAEWAEQEAMAERFIREARIAARLQHANIVTVFDFGRHDDELFIVMELVDGQSLDDILHELQREGRRPSVAQTLQVALDVARALDAAHTLTDDDGEPGGIIHRDVSPANILVSRKGVVKLTDFGIAAWASREGRTSLVAGKPLYMAPEQVRGGALDARTDLFAVGLVVYEMLTGERPWTGMVDTSPDATLEGMGYVPPSTQVSGVPPELDALVARLLAPSPDERVRSARELAKEILQISYRSQIVLDPSELAPLVGDRSEQATAPTLPQYVSKVETLVATGVSPDGVTMLRAADEDAAATGPSPSQPEREPSRERGGWWMAAAALLLGVGAAAVFLLAGPKPGAEEGDRRGAEASERMESRGGEARAVGGAGGGATTDVARSTDGPSVASARASGQPSATARGATEAGGASGEPSATARGAAEAGGASGEADRAAVAGGATTEAGASAGRAAAEGVADRAGTADGDSSGTAAADDPGRATDGRGGAGRRAEVGAPARGGAETTRAEAGETGELDVFSRPWAQIFIDGERQPQNAPARGLRVAAGRRRVRLVNPVLGLAEERTVVVPAGGRAQLRVFLDGED